MKTKNLVFLLLFVVYPFSRIFGQIGGEGIYRFLDITNSAKVAALGGTQIAFADNDLDLAFFNPSLLTDSMRNQLSVNYVSYIAGLGAGYVAYAPNFKGKNTIAVGLHYINYGKFNGASETGELTGTFGAAEYALNLIFSRRISQRFRAGINLKPIFSSFESYQSFGIAADAGVTWMSGDNFLIFSLVARNFGSQITTYYDNAVRERLPWDIQLGFSKQLSHAPVRLLITVNRLNKWDLSYTNSQNERLQSETQSNGLASLLMRHLIFGVELLPESRVTLRFGYNYQRQKELAVSERPGLVGFSTGLGIKIAKFNFNYGIASYHLSATSHYFSLSANLSQLVH